jgi:hypothetical protein
MALKGRSGTASLAAKCVEKYSNADSDNPKEIKYREKHGNILEQYCGILKCRSNPVEVYLVFSSLGELPSLGGNRWRFGGANTSLA